MTDYLSPTDRRRLGLDVPPPLDDADYYAATNGDHEVEVVDPSFLLVDLAPVLAGTVEQPTPSILRRDDGQCLFYVGQVNGVHGDSGIGKGWVVLAAIGQQVTAGRNVMLLDTEDVAPSIVARLRILGITDTAIRDHLMYVRPTAPFGTFNVDHLVELVTERNVSLVVIDSLGECFGLDAIDENHDAEVGPWLRRVARRLADAGPAVVIVDHATKSADNPLHPSGSKRKRAAIGGASYLVTALRPLVAATGGLLRLTCAKDRHGTYARGEVVADIVMDTTVLGTRVDVYTPDAPDEYDAALPILLAARAAVRAVRDAGREMTVRSVVASMAIKAGSETKRAGIELAVARGALTETAGPRNARLFQYVHDLDDPKP